MSTVVLMVLVHALMGVWTAPAHGLADAAFKEAFRRAALPESVRSLTNADLGPAVSRPTLVEDEPDLVATPERLASEEGPTASRQGPEPVPEQGEDWWRTRMTTARETLEQDRVLVAALESRVASLTTDVVNQDDPVRRDQLIADRVRAMAELKRLREQVDLDVEAISGIEDEARKAGVPPGWLRGRDAA